MTRYHTARDTPSQPVSARRVPSALRVMHVDAGREWRGGERQLLLLAAGLRERGAEPFIAARPGSPLLHRLKAEGFATAALAMRTDLDLFAVRRLRRLIATWNPDVVHAHDTRSHALALGALVGRRARIPLVVTRRFAVRPRGLVRFGPRVARFIAISGAVRDALLLGGVVDDRVTVIYPGVSAGAPYLPRDWRAECGWPAGTLVTGVVGPITRDRAHADLERIISALSPSVADRIGLVLLGGHAEGRTTLSGVRAFCAGFVHDVPRALAGLDLLLHPGGADGLGTAVIEAMALGVPTVAFGTGGIAEVIEHGRSGLLVPSGDHLAFASAVGRAIAEPALRASLGDAGPARAREFDPGRMVDSTLSVYRDLIERSAV